MSRSIKFLSGEPDKFQEVRGVLSTLHLFAGEKIMSQANGLKHKRFRVAMIVLLTLSAIINFQNCGKTPGSAAATSGRILPQSPFYDQRVRLDDVSEDAVLSKASESPDQRAVSMLIHNACALEQCTVSDAAAESVACRILEKQPMVEGLEDSMQAYVWTPPAGANASSIEETLRSNTIDNECVMGVTWDYAYKMESTEFKPSDPKYADQYFHKTIKGHDVYKDFRAANPQMVYVAVIDSGYQNHEDLPWVSNVKVGTACDTVCHWHGNFVAGIINGYANSKGGQGVAPNAFIYSYQIGDAAGTVTTTELINALQKANTNTSIEIINMSLGGSGLYDYGIQDGMMTAMSKGKLIVVAAGNNSNDLGKDPIYPAAFNFDGQITVAAASPTGILGATAPFTQEQLQSTIKRDTFSNYSSSLVHVAAPGSHIYSTVLNNSYGVANGTSFSAPIVTGALALGMGYLKAKGHNVSPRVLRSLFLESLRTEDSMNELINGVSTPITKNNRYVDLFKFKQALDNLVSSAATTPAQISIVSTAVDFTKNPPVVKIRADVRDGDLTAGLTLRAYTNKSFLTESDTGYQCSIQGARQVCDIEISYNQLYADPEIYLQVTDRTGKVISDYTLPKTAINMGNKLDAEIKGAITGAFFRDSSFEIEGWACLSGFADPLNIEIRLNNLTSSPVSGQTITTNRQARGTYFQECNSPEISVGFRYTVPTSWVTNSASYKIYFTAVHPETGKTKHLKVYSRQPAYSSTDAAAYEDYVLIDSNLSNQNMDIIFTKREFKNFILTLEGTACYRSSYKPAVFTLGLANGDSSQVYRLFPEMRSVLGAEVLGELPSTLQSPTIKTVSRHLAATNPGLRAIDNRGWLHSSDLFSDISKVVQFTSGVGAGDSTKEFLTYVGDSMKDQSGLLTVHPDIEMNDGCRVPSGFKVSLDIRPYIKEISGGFSVMYRGDVYTEEQILQLEGLQKYKDLFNLPRRTESAFNSLVFQKEAFSIFYETTFSGYRNNIFIDNYNFQSYVIHGFLNKISTLNKGWMSLTSSYKSNANQTSVEPGRRIGMSAYRYPTIVTGRDPVASAKMWAEPLSLVLTTSTSTTATQRYLSEIVPTDPAHRFFAVISFSDATEVGYLNEDFRLQVRYSATGPWYDLALDQFQYSSSTKSGTLIGSVGTPGTAVNQAQFRILATGENALKVTSFGFMTD